MFRLTTAPARNARSFLGVPLIQAVTPTPTTSTSTPAAAAAASATAAAAVMGIRTIKLKPKKVSKRTSRPDPDAKFEKAMRTWDNSVGVTIRKRKFEELKRVHDTMYKNTMSSREMYDTYTQFLDRLGRNQDHMLEEYLRDEKHVSGGMLYEVAMVVIGFADMPPADWHVFCNLLNTAAYLGYEPAALTLAAALLRPNHDKYSYFNWPNAPNWHHARARVRRLIQEGRNPNAFVVEGLEHMNDDRFKDALASFRRALDVASSGSAVHFEWIGYCLSLQGRVLEKLGRIAEAVEVFRQLANLDYCDGYYHLARMRPRDPQAIDWLTKAAASHMEMAYKPLMQAHIRESQRLAREGNLELAKKHEMDAAEWGLLAEEAKKSRGPEED
ncbi:hypothetical protein C8034_v002147 [Colletotrichum sidae]|uniref:Uncharacterized protein n=1 Tax=Colletotrichum sidae TaxID=1347389 RepID=A0A4R8TTN2_9PEZI|nr:hypothetical protein C8034_v002147 [Colletotrichum sidae]